MNEVMKKEGDFSWAELMTSDAEPAKKFYSELFDWHCEDISCDGVAYTIVKNDGKEIAGIMKRPEECAGMPPAWGCYVTVRHISQTIEQCLALGGKLLMPIKDISGTGQIAVIQDPQGATLNLIEYV